MSQPERMAQLMEGHPAQVFGSVLLLLLAGWESRADQNITAFISIADGKTIISHTASSRNVVKNDIHASPRILQSSNIGECNQSVEAIG